jgi:hypothetical protein
MLVRRKQIWLLSGSLVFVLATAGKYVINETSLWFYDT